MATVSARPFTRWSSGRLIRLILFYGGVIGFLGSILLPIYYISLTAFSPGARLFTVPLTYLPASLNFEHFNAVLANLPLVRYFANTVFLATASTLLGLLVSFLGAYAIARLHFPGANLVLVGLLASSMLPGVTTVIPLFQMYQQLGLMNTLAGLLILYTSALLPFTTWLLVSFLRQVPEEVEEAAKVDGAGLVPVLWSIVLPMIRAGMATLFIINFIANWNEFFIPLIFAPGGDTKVITMALFEAQTIGSGSQFYASWGNVSAVALMVIVPIFIMTLVFQKQIVEGIMAGVFK
jgi:ABC-type glycerol-3-phosphate transport system permease component